MSIAKQIHLQLAIMLYLTRVSNANVNGIEGIFERMKEFFGGQSGQGSSLGGGSPILSQGYPGYPSGQFSQFSGVGGMPPGLQGQLQFPGANGASPMLPSPLLQQGSNNIPPGFPVPPTQSLMIFFMQSERQLHNFRLSFWNGPNWNARWSIIT